MSDTRTTLSGPTGKKPNQQKNNKTKHHQNKKKKKEAKEATQSFTYPKCQSLE